MGAVMEASGVEQYSEGDSRPISLFDRTRNLFPLLTEIVEHPASSGHGHYRVWFIIVRLNNDYGWTRERIADWVETIEAQQELLAVGREKSSEELAEAKA